MGRIGSMKVVRATGFRIPGSRTMSSAPAAVTGVIAVVVTAAMVTCAPVQAQTAQGGTPQVIRPSATIGPGVPGQPTPSVPIVPGQPAAGPAGGQGGASASAAPSRFPGMARFRSVAKPDAVLFDAPSDKAKKLFVAPEGMPVEVVSVLRTWVKVRDPLGDFTWINRDDLSDRRTLVAMTVAPLLREPQSDAPAWFNVDRGVLLELLEERPVNGFLRVRYAEGQIGYIQPSQVWGL